MPGTVSLRNGVKFTEWASGVTAAPRLRGAAVVQQPLRIAVGSERVHWARPELVAEVKYLTWTDNNLSRRASRHPKPAAAATSAISSRQRLKCSTVAVRQNVRPGGRNAWRDRPIRGGSPASASGAPVPAAFRPSPGNDRRRRVPPVFRPPLRPSRERTGREPERQ